MQKKTISAKKPCFFAISCTRIFWFNILSLGFYQLYWFYKNWQALRTAGQKVNPVIRAWFFPFLFVFPLFANIKNNINPNKKTVLCLRTAPFLFLFDAFLSVFVPDEIMIWFVPEIIVIILTAFVMQTVQKAINNYNSVQNPETELRRTTTIGENVSVLMLPILFLASFTYSCFQAYIGYHNITDIDKPQNFLTAVTFKHLSVYPFVCEKHGYIMKNYQQAFLRAYADEIENYERFLYKQGITMTGAWKKQPQDVVKFIINLTFQELEDIRADMSATITKDDTTNQTKTVFSAKHACAMLDKSADTVFEQNENLKRTLQKKIKVF